MAGNIVQSWEDLRDEIYQSSEDSWGLESALVAPPPPPRQQHRCFCTLKGLKYGDRVVYEAISDVYRKYRTTTCWSDLTSTHVWTNTALYVFRATSEEHGEVIPLTRVVNAQRTGNGRDVFYIDTIIPPADGKGSYTHHYKGAFY